MTLHEMKKPRNKKTYLHEELTLEPLLQESLQLKEKENTDC